MSRTVAQVRIIIFKTLPWLDCIDATIELVQDPSIRKAKRLVYCYKKATARLG